MPNRHEPPPTYVSQRNVSYYYRAHPLLPRELYTQLALIVPKFATYSQFTMRYCNANSADWDSRGASNSEELGLLLNKRFMIRRTKDELGEGFTDKLREKIPLEVKFDTDTRRKLKRHAILYKRHQKGRKHDESFMAYYADTAAAKVNAVCDYLECLLDISKDKFIIFAYHKVMLEGISELLDDLDVDFIRIDGTTKQDLRNDLINRFQTDEDYRVAVMSLKSCGTGVTLTAAKMVIFAELTYTPGVSSFYC